MLCYAVLSHAALCRAVLDCASERVIVWVKAVAESTYGSACMCLSKELSQACCARVLMSVLQSTAS